MNLMPRLERRRTQMRCWAAVLLITLAPWTARADDVLWRANDLNPARFHPAPDNDPVVLVQNGQPKAKIALLPAEPSRELRRAALDLQAVIEKSTGAKLEIVAGPAPPPAIVIGNGPLAAAQGLNGSGMPVEGFAIKTAPGYVFIVGNPEPLDATEWGVYEFLERFLGVRWYWPDDLGMSLKPTKDLVIPAVWLSDAPFFRKRTIYPSGGFRVAGARVGVQHRRLRAASSWPVKLRVHAPHGWGALYRDKRPEIFQRRADGERDFSMLCYGHPLTLQTYLEEIETQRQPEAEVDRRQQIVDGNNITVSPNDMAIACRCQYCQKLWRKDGGQYGSASVVLTTFVRQLGVAVKRRWPEMTVIFLPYKNYTYAPANMSLPNNVEIQICGMPGLAQYKEPAINASEQANIDAWRRLSGRAIQNWHYSCWPANQTKAAYLFPYTVQAHYRANRRKTVGSFINGINNHWPRQHLSLYVWLKVLWNPELDVDAVIDEYCRRMYGPAAATMRQLVSGLIDGWEKSRWPDGAFSPRSVYEFSYPRKDVVRLEGMLEQALAQAANDQLATDRLNYYAKPLREFFQQSKDYAEGTGLTTLNVYQVADEPVIDGKLDEPGWKGFEAISLVRAMDRKQKQPNFPTTLKAVWTRRGITFGFHMQEPTPAALRRDIGADSRDAALIWWNDNVEIFLDVTGKRSGYCQFIINANGALFDSQGKNAEWNAPGVKAAAFIGKDYWDLEVYIPYDSFDNALAPGTGVEWFGNFTRHRVTDRKNREYLRLSTTYAGPSNDQNAFGPVRFIER